MSNDFSLSFFIKGHKPRFRLSALEKKIEYIKFIIKRSIDFQITRINIHVITKLKFVHSRHVWQYDFVSVRLYRLRINCGSFIKQL